MMQPLGMLSTPGVFQSVFPAFDVLPLVFDSPHSGRRAPEDFCTVASDEDLAWTADSYVDDLFADVPASGATLIAASFPRAYVDVNRAPDDIDPELLAEPWPEPLRPTRKSHMGSGLIWRYCRGTGAPLYDRKLSVDEVRSRIDGYWRPYHEHLADTLGALHRRFGFVYYVNCHSMRAVGNRTLPDPQNLRPDIALGNRHGSTCDGEIVPLLEGSFRERGYQVAVNDPFPGAYLIEIHGRPDQGRYSVQIEINRSLYMDEETRRPHAGYPRVRQHLAEIAAGLADFVRFRVQAEA